MFTITNLLLCVEAYKAGRFTHEKIKNEIFDNDEFRRFIINQLRERMRIFTEEYMWEFGFQHTNNLALYKFKPHFAILVHSRLLTN